MRVVSIKVNEDFLEVLRAEASRRGLSVSEFIREAIRYYILKASSERKVIATRKIRIYL